jgi:hypothetical protein
MSLIDAACVEYNEVRKLYVAAENGKKYVLDNQSALRVRKVSVDKCVKMPDGCGRCDYLFSIDESVKRTVYFIELKGGRGEDALKQINDTFDFLKADFDGYIFEARVVGSRSIPGLTRNPHYKKLLRKIDPMGGNIKIATNKFYKDII